MQCRTVKISKTTEKVKNREKPGRKVEKHGYEYCMPGLRGVISAGDLDRICGGNRNPGA